MNAGGGASAPFPLVHGSCGATHSPSPGSGVFQIVPIFGGGQCPVSAPVWEASRIAGGATAVAVAASVSTSDDDAPPSLNVACLYASRTANARSSAHAIGAGPI